ncbi:Hypothetical_protein [Hexamita inflata]|uniref:Hypothetical_protein n=1 Tax=Hexamita inflata TaxID=28002 RepID=A0ABP1JYI6_9EUKA
MQNRNSSLSQRKLRRRSKQKNIRYIFLEQERTKQGINAPKPQETVNPPPALYSEIRSLQIQMNKEGTHVPNPVNEVMCQRQPYQKMSTPRINFSCKPKEITSKQKLRSDNLFLKIKLANQVKIVRQRLSERPAGSIFSEHK